MGIFLEDESETTNTPRTVQSGEPSFQVRDYIPLAIASILVAPFFIYLVAQLDDFEAKQSNSPTLPDKLHTTRNVYPEGTMADLKYGCLHSNEIEHTGTEQARMDEITIGVLENKINITKNPSIALEFWSILDKYGKLCEEDVQILQTAAGNQISCNKLFWSDALASVRAKSVLRSPAHLSCERAYSTVAVTENQLALEQMVAGKPILLPDGTMKVVTESMIITTINNYDSQLENIKLLFTPPQE